MSTTNSDIELSIVVISYNTLDMTRACLDSVFIQAGDLLIKVIVVDNDSRDGSVEMIANEFPQAILIRNQQNKGFAVANNEGFEFVEGKYVLLLNSDTVVLGDVLQQSLKYLGAHPDTGAMGCRVLNSDGSMQRTCSGYPSLSRLLLKTIGLDRVEIFDTYLLRSWKRDSEREVETISGCYLMLRKEIIDELGGLDESFFFFGEETDWCLQMRKASWRLMFAPVGEITHHGGGSVKKLHHLRDIMLSEATIRLHRKNSGLPAAVAAFTILLIFNSSRALAWSLRSLVQRTALPRARHFCQVTIRSLKTWPA